MISRKAAKNAKILRDVEVARKAKGAAAHDQGRVEMDEAREVMVETMIEVGQPARARSPIPTPPAPR
jgi:hypothetical protein